MQHHTGAVSMNEQQMGTKRKYTSYIPRTNQGKCLGFWIIAFGFGFLAIYVYKWIDAGHQETREEGLVRMCDQMARMLQDQFAVSVHDVRALAVFISIFHYYKNPSVLDQETFAKYTKGKAFERPLLSGVSYAQMVMNLEREDFERQHGGTIITMEREPSPLRDEYAPVIFTQEKLSYLKLVDMMSGEEDRENIQRARSTGKAVLTGPFKLLGSHHLGVILSVPVYKSKLPPNASVRERIEATAGCIGGAFDVESLLENLLGQHAGGNPEIVVKVYDVTNTSDPLIMYGRQNFDGDMSRVRVNMLDFGDPFRKHQMTCRYLHQAPISWTVIIMATLGYVIVLLAGYMFCTGAIHIVQVEDDFDTMQQLKVRAEAADVAMSQFRATVSHEIRTHMNGMLGMLELLLDTELSSTQRNYAQTAQACGRLLITLINEVLDKAKIEAAS